MHTGIECACRETIGNFEAGLLRVGPRCI
uniref:Uncharacterized protein n=1 Tax=Arundo donax TaxID=35708 RepID=A0A0A8Z677_ARUDO